MRKWVGNAINSVVLSLREKSNIMASVNIILALLLILTFVICLSNSEWWIKLFFLIILSVWGIFDIFFHCIVFKTNPTLLCSERKQVYQETILMMKHKSHQHLVSGMLSLSQTYLTGINSEKNPLGEISEPERNKNEQEKNE